MELSHPLPSFLPHGGNPSVFTGREDAEGGGGSEEASRGRRQKEEGSVQHGGSFWGLPGQGESSLCKLGICVYKRVGNFGVLVLKRTTEPV